MALQGGRAIAIRRSGRGRYQISYQVDLWDGAIRKMWQDKAIILKRERI
jgi:hypothetical protein